MAGRNVDILCVSVNSSGRDMGVFIPILYYCEKILGLSTFFASGIDGCYWLDKLNPRLFIVPDSVGDKNYIKAVKYAAKRVIPAISLTSEGDLNGEIIDEMLWGWNKEKKMYEDLNLQWSERGKKMILEYCPELSGKISVSGGIGFDRYKIYEFMNRREFLKKYKKDYKKIVCVAGWGFDYFLSDLLKVSKIYKKEQIENFRKERITVNKILGELIQNNKDVLFILKYHPGA